MRGIFAKTLVLMLLLPIFGNQGVAMAAENFQESLESTVYLEYDTPGVKVELTGAIANNSEASYDGTFDLYIPQGAFVDMLCERNASGQAISHNKYKLETNRTNVNLQVVKASLTKSISAADSYYFHLQYSLNPFGGQEQRNYTYQFTSAYPVSQLNVAIVQPAESSNFNISPQTTEIFQEQGLNWYHYPVYDIAAETPQNYQISYFRSSNKTSQDILGNVNSSAGDTTGLADDAIVVVLIILAVAAVAVALFLMRSKQQKPAANVRSKPTSGKQHDSMPNERRKARQMLLDGKISEATYKQLLKDISKNL